MKYFFKEHKEAAVILAAALLMRIAAGLQIDIFLDEAVTFFKSENSISLIFSHDTNEPMLPFWYCFCHIWRRLGQSMFFMRLPAVLCSAAALLFSYGAALKAQIFNDDKKNKSFALLSLLFYAFSYVCILSDTQIRIYGFLSLCISGMAFYALDIYKKGTGLKSCLLLAVFAFFGCLSHYIGCAAALGIGLWFLFVPGNLKEKALRFACILPGFLLSSGYFIFNFFASKDNFAHNSVSAFNNAYSIIYLPSQCLGIDDAADSFFSNYAFMGSLQTIWNGCEIIADLALWGLLFVSVKYLFSKDKYFAALAVIIPGLPLAGLCLGSMLGMQPLQARYMNSQFCALSWIIAAVFFRQCENHESIKEVFSKNIITRVFAFILAADAFASLALPFVPGLWYQNWKPIVKFVNENKTSDRDLVLSYIPSAHFAFLGNYETEKIHYQIGTEGVPDSFRIDKDYKGLALSPLYAQMLTPEFFKKNSDNAVFLIMNQAEVLGTDTGFIMNALDAHYEIDKEEHTVGSSYFSKIDVYRLMPKKK